MADRRSAYHAGRSVSESAHELIVQLPLHFSHSEGTRSLNFSELAYALDAVGKSVIREDQQEILTQLFEKARQISGNSALEMYLLLKMMMPAYDNECVYGMKTRRLALAASDALRKLGRSEGSATIKQWLKNVPLQNSIMAKGKGIVCLPELVIAGQCARASLSSHGPGRPPPEPTTLVQIAVVCRMLTTVYLSAQSSQQQLETAQSEILRQVIEEGGLSFQEWLTLHRLLLKKITMGVGLQTMLNALPLDGARERFAKQMDLSRLAEMCVSPSAAAVVLCGVPFCPMTCRNMRSPYLMQWLFSKSIRVGDGLVGPKDNLLVIIGVDWFVTVSKVADKEKLYVDIKSDAALTTMKSRKGIVMRLREFQRAGMLKGAKGQIIHFQMTDNKDVIEITLLELSERTSSDLMLHDNESVWEPVEEVEDLNDLIVVAKAQAKNKTLQIIVKPPLQAHVSQRPGLRNSAKAKAKPAAKVKEPMLMVQQKLDGDRIQVHIRSAGDVKLFTKWGKDVTELYSNVCDDLVALNLVRHAPCILDGELLVVNRDTSEPIAWSSTKWTYNEPLSKLVDDGNTVVALSHNGGEEEGAYGTLNDTADEEGEGDLRYVSFRGIRKCDPWVRGRLIDRGILRVVFYDIIMHQGKAVHDLGCRDRFELLTQQLEGLLEGRSKHCRVLKESHDLNSLEALLDRLRESVRRGQEGLVLKDPLARYEFGNSAFIQKLKLSGPDINTGVMGIGGTLSGNPRMCGLLTCILWEHEMVLSYCRVEFLEGDDNWRGMEHIMDELDSRVSVSELEAGMRAGKPVNLPKYSVLMSSSPLGRKVVWRPVREEDMRFRCEALIMPGDLADVQWLVSPYECRFGLSVRGDLKAVESNETGAKLWKPRNPVGRLEIRGFQMSTLDTHASIVSKFEHAQEVETCVERHAMRRIAELRALPARQPRVVEIARLLESMQASAKWPQPLPSQMPSIIGLNTLLKESKLKDLTPEERLALRGNKNDSQWKTWKQTKSSRLDTAEDATEKAERIADLAKLSERFRELTAKMAEGGGLATVMSSRLVHSSCDCLSAQVSFIDEVYVSPLQTMQEEFLKEYE